jgi:hypothetical protein
MHLMTRWMTWLLGLAWLGLAAAPRPVRADDTSNALLDWVNEIYATDEAVNERLLTPAGWPLALHLPADGTLLVPGDPGAEEGGLEGDDFQWSLGQAAAILSAGSGSPYMLNGTHFPLGLDELTEQHWLDFDAEFRAHPQADAEQVSAELDRQLAGRRWMVYHDRLSDPAQPDKPVDVCFAVTLTPEAVYMFSMAYYAAPDGALDSGLERMLGTGADPAQPAG